MKRIRMPRPGVVLGVIAVILAAGGTAIAASNLKLADFESSSRDRLAGTGVIQYAASNQTTPATTPSFGTVHTFTVRCELAKKATAGGFKWTGGTPPNPGDYQLLDAYPNGSGFVVRLQLRPDDPMTPVNEGSGLGQPLAVYANCVKSRKQNGAPPA
jgi:hypothetical protein